VDRKYVKKKNVILLTLESVIRHSNAAAPVPAVLCPVAASLPRLPRERAGGQAAAAAQHGCGVESVTSCAGQNRLGGTHLPAEQMTV